MNQMSLEALGHIIGVGKSSVHGYEAGENYPNPEALVKIAQLGNKSLDWLITGHSNDDSIYPTIPHGHGTVQEPAPLELNLIKETVEAVESYLQSNHIKMAPAKIAELIVALYEEACETKSRKINEGTLIRMIKLAS